MLTLLFLVWGVFGCSNTSYSWLGLRAVEPEIVHARGGTGRCTMRRIAREVRGEPGHCLPSFEDRVDQWGEPQAIWFQLCYNGAADAPEPDAGQRRDFDEVLDWLEQSHPGAALYLSSLPDNETGCFGGPDEWFAHEVAETLIDEAVAGGRVQRGPVLPTYELEDVRASDPDCLEHYGKCDLCHQNLDRILEDGLLLQEWLSQSG